MRINFKIDAKITQQKGRRIIIQFRKAVDEEISRVLKEGHNEKINEMKDDVFIRPTVITVKKDRPVKIALDARTLNQPIEKDKVQLPTKSQNVYTNEVEVKTKVQKSNSKATRTKQNESIFQLNERRPIEETNNEE